MDRLYEQNAIEMLVTARKALVNCSSRATSMVPVPMGRSIATSPTVMRTARMMEMQAIRES